MKPRRIVLVDSMSWKTQFQVFISTFGILWLFTEPLLGFGIGTSLFQCLGFWGYGALFCLSILVVVFVNYYKKSKAIGKITFIRFKVVLIQDGTVHPVEVPEQMLVRRFLDLFIKDVSKESANPIMAKWDMFETTLLVERPPDSNKFVGLSKNKTIKEAGLQNDDVCRLNGRVLESSVIFSPET